MVSENFYIVSQVTTNFISFFMNSPNDAKVY